MRPATAFKVSSLGAMVFTIVTVNTALFPVFPALRADLGLTLTEVSLLVVFVNVPSALLSPAGGYLADRFNRKAIIIPSMIMFGAGGLLAGLAAVSLDNPFPYMLGARVIQGIGAAAPMYLAMALAGDIFQSTERAQAVGLMEAASGMGKLAAPLLGAIVGLIAWQAPFFIYPALSLPVAAAVFWLIKEPSKQKDAQQNSFRESLKPILKKPTLIGLLVAFITLFVLIGTMFWLSEALEERIQGGPILKGFIIAVPVISFLAITLLAEYVYRLLKVRNAIIAGLAVVTFSLAALPPARDNFMLWPVIILLGAGLGIATPALDTLSTNIVSVEHRGIVTTFYGSMRCLGAAAGPYGLARLMKMGPLSTFWIPAAATAAVVLLVLILLHEREIPGKLDPAGEKR